MSPDHDPPGPGRPPGPQYGPGARTGAYGPPAPARRTGGREAYGPPAPEPQNGRGPSAGATAPVHGPVTYGPRTSPVPGPPTYGPRTPYGQPGPRSPGSTRAYDTGSPTGPAPVPAGHAPVEPDPGPTRAPRASARRSAAAGWILPGVVVVVAALLGVFAFATLASLDPAGDNVLATAGALLTVTAVLGGMALLLLLVTPVVAVIVRRAWAIVAAVLSVLAPLVTLLVGVYAGGVVATDNATDGLEAIGALVSRTADLVDREGGDSELLREVGRTISGT